MSQRDVDRREVKAGRMTLAAYEAKYHAPEPDLRALLVKALAALERIDEWWKSLPPSLRQDIEGSGAEPGAIAHNRTTAAEIREELGRIPADDETKI